MTLRVSLLHHVNAHPDQTATEIAKHLGAKLPSVASMLNQMFRQGAVNRHPGGPRGGYRYTLTPPFPRPTSWERLRDAVDQDSV